MESGINFIHIAGYFVLPGILDDKFSDYLNRAQELGIITSLDVVGSPRMDKPDSLWSCLSKLDIFLCNEYEGRRLSGEKDPVKISEFFHSFGTRNVIIKLEPEGCWLSFDGYTERISGRKVDVVDTTGAGDGFAAGLLSALAKGNDLIQACAFGNEVGG